MRPLPTDMLAHFLDHRTTQNNRLALRCEAVTMYRQHEDIDRASVIHYKSER
jgi:hypothetical protein